MQEPDREVFLSRLEEGIATSPIYDGNYAKFSSDLGKNDRYISNLRAKKSEPGLFTVRKMARLLDTSVSWLSGETSEKLSIQNLSLDGPLNSSAVTFLNHVTTQIRRANILSGVEPSIDDIMTAHHEYDGQYIGLKPLEDWLILVACPDKADQRISVMHVGSKSLAARTPGHTGVDSVQHAIDNVPDERFKIRLMEDHKRAALGEFVVSNEQLDHRAPGYSRKIRMRYRRILKSFTLETGTPVIVNYSRPFRQEF